VLIIRRPQKITVEHHTCHFHELHPGVAYPGCCCSSSYSSRDKTIDEMTETERKAFLDPFGGFAPTSEGK
jgi:hypothetical protein